MRHSTRLGRLSGARRTGSDGRLLPGPTRGSSDHQTERPEVTRRLYEHDIPLFSLPLRRPVATSSRRSPPHPNLQRELHGETSPLDLPSPLEIQENLLVRLRPTARSLRRVAALLLDAPVVSSRFAEPHTDAIYFPLFFNSPLLPAWIPSRLQRLHLGRS